jgi:hypothetical protein
LLLKKLLLLKKRLLKKQLVKKPKKLNIKQGCVRKIVST